MRVCFRVILGGKESLWSQCYAGVASLEASGGLSAMAV